MPLPETPLTIQGGCNCGAIRYNVSVPEIAKRPHVPYHDPQVPIADEIRLPMIAVDNCNDCRRATGAVLPMWLVTEIAIVTVSCLLASLKTSEGFREEARSWVPAVEIFKDDIQATQGTFLGFYKSSPQRTRFFCTRCGTMLAYSMDVDAPTPFQDAPQMLDIILGTIDTEILHKDWAVPERRLWCDLAIPWVYDLVGHGLKELPSHPTWKINESMGKE